MTVQSQAWSPQVVDGTNQKVEEDQHIAGPPNQKVGGDLSRPVPVVVALMRDGDGDILLTLLINNQKLRHGLYYLSFLDNDSVFFMNGKWCHTYN